MLRGERRFQCRYEGCTWTHWAASAKRDHEAEPHFVCSCGRCTTARGLLLHQRTCTTHQLALAGKLYICSGCEQEIVEGMHCLQIPIVNIEVRQRAGYEMVSFDSDASLTNLRFCMPLCFLQWVVTNELMLTVFHDDIVDA